MILRNRLQPHTIIRIGLLFVVAAILSARYLHPGAALSADLVDAAEGFLYGVSIACMLWGVVLQRRRGSASKADPCK
jgi:hypothetical protein